MKQQFLIFQNNPLECYSKKTHSKFKTIISLTGRVWLDLFKVPIKVGDFVNYANLLFRIDIVGEQAKVESLNRYCADITISREFNLKKETIPTHLQATKIYNEIKKKEQNKLNPPKPKPIPIEKIAPYILYLIEKGEGCDYTIGCGEKLEYINKETEKDAIKEAKEKIEWYGKERIESATLMKITWRKELI